MKTFVGIDLGSTTTKAILLDENSHVIGRGITNSRSNYATAARVASEEAHVDGRFTLFRRALNAGQGHGCIGARQGSSRRDFRSKRFLRRGVSGRTGEAHRDGRGNGGFLDRAAGESGDYSRDPY